MTVDGNKITVVYYAFDGVSAWTPFDTYTYTLTSRKFGANDANQSLDPDTLTNYYQGIGWGIGLTKIGLGTLTLTSGTTTYSSTIRVSAGGLNVQGDYSRAPVIIQSGAAANLEAAGKVADVTVDSGGLLSGTGTVVGSLMNSGTVSPGNSPGTLNVVGSYTQTSSGTLRAEVASPTSYDKISVTGAGTASLNGTVTPVLLNGYRPPVNTRFPDIITDHRRADGHLQHGDPARLAPPCSGNRIYNATSFGLTVQRDYANQWLGLNSNQQQVGLMLNSVAGTTTGDLGAVLDTLDNLPARC